MSEFDTNDPAPITREMERPSHANGQNFSITDEMERWQAAHGHRLTQSADQIARDGIHAGIQANHQSHPEDISA